MSLFTRQSFQSGLKKLEAKHSATKKVGFIRALPIVSMAIAASLLVSSCATTGNITPQYIAPSTYQTYDCNSLSQEYNRINNYVTQAQSSKASFATTGVGFGISAGRWGISPNINIGVGKSTNTQARDAKLSRLFGERDAVVQSARMKHCDFATGLKVYGEK